MLKIIPAALLAVSVLAAPALAASTDKTTQAPVAKSASVDKPAHVKKSAVKMGRHHVTHSSHHRLHKKMATDKVHESSKLAAKRVTPPAKRG
jgi:hypothetical protein